MAGRFLVGNADAPACGATEPPTVPPATEHLAAEPLAAEPLAAEGAAGDDDLAVIAAQLGVFLRSTHLFLQNLHGGPQAQPAAGAEPALERAAYRLLGRLAGGGPARLSGLAADMCVDLSTVSRQVAALESAGLLRRTAEPNDRRASVIEATGRGHEAFARYQARRLRALRELLAGWTPTERRQFARLFTRFNAAIAAGNPGGTGQEKP